MKLEKNNRKGIILAGGKGTRLYPLTSAISKQILPVYDKPMIFYPLSNLMLANIRDILVISTKQHIELFRSLLGDGSTLGIKLSYKIQEKPKGIAEALVIGETFLEKKPCALVLGDNIFFGNRFTEILEKASKSKYSSIFALPVSNPEEFGIVEFNKNLKIKSLKEKPKKPKSNYAVTGLYFYDKYAPLKAKKLKPSKRGELEITDLNKMYLKEKKLKLNLLPRGFNWFDAGTTRSLLEVSELIKNIQSRSGYMIGCLEEIALKKNWISKYKIKTKFKNINNSYSNYIKRLCK